MPYPELVFNKIENGDIFTRDFQTFVTNNTIRFSNTEGMAVVYGPNGTGKTSLVNAFSSLQNSKIAFSFNENQYTNGETTFHVINDQNNRNVIKGTAKDFLLGNNIRREFELQEYIVSEHNRLLTVAIAMLKNKFNLSTANNPVILTISNAQLQQVTKALANNKNKGKDYTPETLIEIITNLTEEDIPDYSEEKFSFVINDLASKNSVISMIDEIVKTEISPNPHVHEIEENTEAIRILQHFNKSQCIVCDTDGIDRDCLLEQKTANKETVIQNLDEKVRTIIENVINMTPSIDPFNIKGKLLEAINAGDAAIIVEVNQEINEYKKIIEKKICQEYKSILSESEIAQKNQEYQIIKSTDRK